MSAVRNEADTGPNIEANEASDSGNWQEQDVPEISFTEAGTVAEDEEETPTSMLLSPENHRQYQQLQPTSPDTAGRPSSADGSLSIPDDTPSLQVSGPTLDLLQQRKLTLPELHNVLCS